MLTLCKSASAQIYAHTCCLQIDVLTPNVKHCAYIVFSKVEINKLAQNGTQVLFTERCFAQFCFLRLQTTWLYLPDIFELFLANNCSNTKGIWKDSKTAECSNLFSDLSLVSTLRSKPRGRVLTGVLIAIFISELLET